MSEPTNSKETDELLMMLKGELSAMGGGNPDRIAWMLDAFVQSKITDALIALSCRLQAIPTPAEKEAK